MSVLSTIADKLQIPADFRSTYGDFAIKVGLGALDKPRPREADGRLVLVSAITPTPAGEGKTTTSIGLTDALCRIGESACAALREPSLGPCMGVKGGGTGGGKAELVPADRINLHLTGDFHAITSAHNLIAALIDNHVHFASDAHIEPRSVAWPRVIDMNDRVLRDIVVGLGGRGNGAPRESRFDITAASELMAILCLASNAEDLRARIDRTLIGFTREREPITAKSLHGTGAVLALLRDAIEPNLVRTGEDNPVFVHGGPFANIAHGCNSVLATRMAMHHADWTVTEAGFGFDLGAEKFFDIKCRASGLNPAAVVLVASVRALKLHGGRKLSELDVEDTEATKAGLANLEKHLESIRGFDKPPIIALNRFAKDTDAEVDVVRQHCAKLEVPFAVATHFRDGGEGAEELARLVVANAQSELTPLHPTYELDASVPDKIRAVAQAIYGARDISFTRSAARDLRRVEELGYANLPVCIAKTQSSLSDDPRLRGRPRDFEITVRNIQINSGAGFLVVLTGDILRMPGLPRTPRAGDIDLQGAQITGLA